MCRVVSAKEGPAYPVDILKMCPLHKMKPIWNDDSKEIKVEPANRIDLSEAEMETKRQSPSDKR